ncbi:MAG: PHP domain-containing protein, partial [Vicinamibacterales bacterium]
MTDLVAAGRLRDVPFVGPASERIITEFVTQGSSPTVDAAIAKAGNPRAVQEKRAFRDGYLSHTVLAAALEAPAADGVVARADYRGDFQMHSTYSDGTERIAAMAQGAMALGHTCLGITDHSYGLPIARGISMAKAARQWTEIDALNAELRGTFRVFKGIEANILADGSLDVQPDERALFEFVVASPHSLLRRPEDQTARMVNAVNAPGVDAVGWGLVIGSGRITDIPSTTGPSSLLSSRPQGLHPSYRPSVLRFATMGYGDTGRIALESLAFVTVTVV